MGVGATSPGWILCGALLAAAAVWLAYFRPRQSAARAAGAPLADVEALGDTALLPLAQAAAEPTAATRPAVTDDAPPTGSAPAPGKSLPGPQSA